MMTDAISKLPITVLLAAKNEALNLPRCLGALGAAMRVIVLDSYSADATPGIALAQGAEVVQFDYRGGYPKKRQWALEQVAIDTPWVLLLDADEVVPDILWQEIAVTVRRPDALDAYLITKGFHFLGRRFQYGGFSHEAVLLFRTGTARFEHLFDDAPDSLDMEIHERVMVQGAIGRLHTPLIHEDFKGLEAYITRHNKYSTWEARVRYRYLTTGRYGENTIVPRLFGNSQERRRWLKALIIRLPFESLLWFFYHYVLRLGLMEGRPGLIACQVRASYIAQVRAKMYELTQRGNSLDR
ncbi:glycosyltransferase family 2 protein [uncultured Thiodictyon sp.]|jgi:glycosyltransferase involved in cell wall biosynthesis|uniref:glycosyltransferase family 2 protein n=1 Tax=uncultured Thiodictyon sp. TaxID=1846217 RepID=UPI0025DCD461|nr:glycosyltransferase family 2 protein [uncultured Thiodictyon sp.]